MKNLLILLAVLLASCHKGEKYSCICTYPNGKIYDDHDLAKGWTKKVRNYCEDQLGTFGDSIGVKCLMYSNEDNFTRCLDVSSTHNEKDDTGYFFPNMTAIQKQQFVDAHTYNDSVSVSEVVKHYVVCSNEWDSLF